MRSDSIPGAAGISDARRALLEERLGGRLPGASPAGAIPRLGAATAPASFAQQRLWLVDRLAPGNPYYHLPMALRLTGPLDAAALERALGEVVRRHEALRTAFREEDGAPVQVVHPAGAFRLSVEDLSALAPGERGAAALRAAEADETRPFDLSTGPLFRARLLRLGAEEHVLLLAMHHVIGDGWSLGVLFGEVAALYGAFSRGLPSPLPDLAVQYADFAAWQRDRLAGVEMDRLLGYWRSRLDGLAPLELPADRPRAAAPGHRGIAHAFSLPPEVADGVRRIAREEGATTFMVLLAAFQALLARLAGTDDVAVGSPVANRTRPELEGLIGFFVNTLVLRTDLSGRPTFRELVRRVKRATLEAYDHQDLPFERLVEELHPRRDPSRNPLFDVLFTLKNEPGAAPELAGLGLEWLRTGVEEAVAFDVSLTMAERGAGLSGAWACRADLFGAASVEAMASAFTALLRGAAAAPDRPLADIPLAGEAERRRVVEEWNATAVDYPRGRTVAELFEEQARAAPDAPALLWRGGRLTYWELNARADGLARHLRALGAGPEARVGVAMERSPELVVALLAVAKAGAAYVSLDPAHPAERLALMARDAGVALAVVDGAAPEGLEGAVARIVSVDRDADAVAAHPEGGPGPAADPDGLLYVTYTSGSTGTPKGVAVPHRAVVRLVRGQDYARFGPGEVFLHAAPAAFDASTFEVWGPLLNGSAVAVLPPGPAGPAEVAAFCREQGVTTLWLTAGLFHQVVDEGAERLAGVRQLLAGGDVLSVPHVRRALSALPGARLVNGYGPTEATTFTCCHAIRPEDAERARIPIGPPISNTRAYVLDGEMRPLPSGIPGELYVGGDGLARGYLGRPALTAERFVPDPFTPGGRLYRTGDRARWKESAEVREFGSALDPREGGRTDAPTHSRTGVLEFLGRADAQVKVRGHRVEPGEVEAALSALPGVGSAAVALDGAGERLVAYLVPDGAPPAAEEVRAALRRRLPEYMVPSAFVFLAELPRTPNGKVDRRALPPPGAAPSGEAASRPPRNATEAALARIWRDVLGVERVGAEDDFFALGGHSLSAMQVASRVRRTFGVELPLRSLFDAPTVAGLAALLAGPAAAPAPAAAAASIPPARRDAFRVGAADFDPEPPTRPAGAAETPA